MNRALLSLQGKEDGVFMFTSQCLPDPEQGYHLNDMSVVAIIEIFLHESKCIGQLIMILAVTYAICGVAENAECMSTVDWGT